MATIALPISTIERRMRGGTQSLLVRDGAGNRYVAKCMGNPQGTRTLINEWIVSRLLKYLRVSTPEIHLLRIERGIPGDHLLEFEMGNRRIPIAAGLHLGSRCPVDPEQTAIFDFLPRRLLHKVVNFPDLLLAFAFDKWVNQTDSRQAIFIRERSSQASPSFRTYLIDHGQSFGGSSWEFCDGALNGLYWDRAIYDRPDAKAECHRAVDSIGELPENSVRGMEKEIPSEWMKPGDHEGLTQLLEVLCGRRTKLHDTVDRALRQVQQAGLPIPKTLQGRRLLGALLLLACVPGSFSTTAHSGINIEVTPTGSFNGQHAPEDFYPSTGLGLDLTAQAKLGGVVNEYGVQIWRIEEADPKRGKEGQPKDGLYLLRVYADKKLGAGNQLLAEYALFGS